MRLSRSDVKRLYGGVIYKMAPIEAVDEQAEPEASSPIDFTRIFDKGEEIQWKMKPDAKVALVLLEDEFGNRNLTNSLKSFVLQSGINPSNICFGVMSGKEAHCKLTDMPVNAGVIFGGLSSEVRSELPDSVSLGEKDVFFANPLKEILKSESQQTEVVTMLKQVKFLLHL